MRRFQGKASFCGRSYGLVDLTGKVPSQKSQFWFGNTLKTLEKVDVAGLQVDNGLIVPPRFGSAVCDISPAYGFLLPPKTTY